MTKAQRLLRGIHGYYQPRTLSEFYEALAKLSDIDFDNFLLKKEKEEQ
jgi:hypothetical protein